MIAHEFESRITTLISWYTNCIRLYLNQWFSIWGTRTPKDT